MSPGNILCITSFLPKFKYITLIYLFKYYMRSVNSCDQNHKLCLLEIIFVFNFALSICMHKNSMKLVCLLTKLVYLVTSRRVYKLLTVDM